MWKETASGANDYRAQRKEVLALAQARKVNVILSETRVRITILAALNKPFGEWNEVFPNAGCVVTLVDRLVHRSEILTIAGSSYRLKDAQETAALRAAQRSVKKQSC